MPLDLAMMMCVRNEEQFLEANLRYHRLLGVTRAYVFLDRCTDHSERIAQSFDWVVAHARDRAPTERQNHAYQDGCARVALDLARREGARWLLHLDADEFAFGENGGDDVAADGALGQLLERARPETNLIMLRTREVLPVRLPDAPPFWEQVCFQDGGIIERDMLDPSTGEMRRLTKWLGHHAGKSIVRVAAAVEPDGPHTWSQAGSRRRPPVERLGFHYHYVATSAVHWRDKYTRFSGDPSTFPSGAPMLFPKVAFKSVAATMTAPEAARYYDEWVAIGVAEAERYVSEGRAVRDDRGRRLIERAARSA